MLGLPFGLLHASTAPVFGFSHLRQHRVGKIFRGTQKGLTLVQALRGAWGQKGVGGFFLKIRPHSCV